MTVTPSPQSVVPVGPKRVLVLKSAVERLILAADMYGVAHLDSDDMDDDAVELQDATEGMKDALAAAPAPSSLAGGEVVDDLAAHLASSIANLGFPVGLGIAPGKTVCTTAAQAIIDTYGPRLAALSPEAPARSGVGDELIEQLCEAMQDGVGCTPWSNNSWDRDDGVSRGLVRDSVRRVLARQAALTPRHEAPAEGAGEREALAAIMHRNMIPDEDGGFSFHDLKAADQIMDYLRARSSAPEAREGDA